MQTVYDADGKPYTVEAVDAREYVASGSYFFAAPESDAQKVESAPVVEAVAQVESERVMGAAIFDDALAKIRNKPGPKPKQPEA